jgi:hypothetical protein
MLLDYEVMGQGGSGTSRALSLPGQFGGKEGIEHLFLHFRRDASAVVANPDFDRFA